MGNPNQIAAMKNNNYGAKSKGTSRNAMEPKTVKDIADSFIKWSKTEEAIHIDQFGEEWDKSPKWIRELANNHDEIKKALEIGRRNILMKYVKNGMSGKWYFGLVNRYIGYYDHGLDKYEIDRKRKEKEISDKEKKELHIEITNYRRPKAEEANPVEE